MRWLTARATAGAAVLLLASGCAGSDESGGPGRSPAAPSPPAAGTPTDAAQDGPTPTPRAREQLPDSCAGLVPTVAVTEALATPLAGEIDFLFAGPLPDSGRTGRVTCGYRTAPGGPPAVEVSLISYVDAPTAAGRIDLNVVDARDRGDRVIEQPVGDRPGYVILGPDEASLIAADAARTIVVTLQRGVVPDPALRSVLDGVGTAVLHAQRPAATPT